MSNLDHILQIENEDVKHALNFVVNKELLQREGGVCIMKFYGYIQEKLL